MRRLVRPRSPFNAGFTGLWSWFLLGACAAPTEIKLNVYTDVPCAGDPEWKGIAVYVGGVDSNLENKAPALTSTSCDRNGQIGSLVIVPSGSKDDEIGLRVVAGIGQNPEDCATHQYNGCIVARRSLRFSPHSTIDIDITLTGDCRGVGCDTAHTCVDGTCTETTTLPPVSNVVDVPGPSDSASAAGNVRCGDNGVFCPTSGNVCCLSVDSAAHTTSGECRPAQQCPPGNPVLYCDDESDCTSLTDDQGRIGMCQLAYAGDQFTPQVIAGSQCVVHAGTHGIAAYGIELCETRKACVGSGHTCMPSEGEPNLLPNYFWCTYDFNNGGE